MKYYVAGKYANKKSFARCFLTGHHWCRLYYNGSVNGIKDIATITEKVFVCWKWNSLVMGLPYIALLIVLYH
jgi:hypothetical protein